MKKMKLITSLLFAGMMTSGAAVAQQLSSADGEVTMVDCNLLANDIRITLTNGVVAGLQCDTTNNHVALAGCHTKGLSTERSALVLDPNDTPNDATDDCDPNADANGCVEVVSGASFPTATTKAGTVASRFPGSSCDATTVDTYAGNIDLSL